MFLFCGRVEINWKIKSWSPTYPLPQGLSLFFSIVIYNLAPRYELYHNHAKCIYICSYRNHTILCILWSKVATRTKSLLELVEVKKIEMQNVIFRCCYRSPHPNVPSILVYSGSSLVFHFARPKSPNYVWKIIPLAEIVYKFYFICCKTKK